MDCGLVRRQGDCVLCQCADSPFTEPGQLAVPADQPCPPGHTLLRTEGGASVCGQGPPGEDQTGVEWMSRGSLQGAGVAEF